MTDEHDRATGPVHDQISAFIDDELSDEEAAFLVRRFERDPDARRQLLRYTTIGCALRNELLQPDPGVLCRRLDTALNGGSMPALRRPAAAVGRRTRLVRPLVGVGIAAGVAVAAVVALRAVNEVRDRVTPGAITAPVQARQWTEPPSYVVPQDIAEPRASAPPIRLTNYLVHHGEYASRLGRTSVHSNVIGAAVTLPEVEPRDSLE